MERDEVGGGAQDESAKFRRLRDRLKRADAAQDDWRDEAGGDFRFVAGHQWDDDTLQELKEAERPAITFNRTAPTVYSVVGHQINNRMETKYSPRTEGDEQVNEIYTAASRWADDQCDGEDEETDAFTDMVICGMGWTETRMSYDHNPDGELETAARIDPLEFRWDETASKPNLQDAAWVVRLKWTPRKEAEGIWPKLKDIDVFQDLDAVDSDVIVRTDAIPYEGEDVRRFYRPKTDEVLIAEHLFAEPTFIYRVGDPASGRLVELSEAKWRKLRGYIEQQGLQYVRQRIKKNRYEIWAGDNLLEDGEEPTDQFRYQCMTGYRDRREDGTTLYYGLVRPMRDPQMWSNKFFSQIQDIIMSNRVGGAFIEETALTDPRQAERDWAAVNPLIVLRDGAVSSNKVVERNPLPYPVGLDRLMEWAVGALPQVTGVNMELLGLQDRNQPGVLEAQRKRAAMAILAPLFNSLRRHKKERGRLVLHHIREDLSDGRLIRVVGESGGAQ